MTTALAARARFGLAALNGRYHRPALTVFAVIVVAHWTEHLVQAAQIWIFGTARPQARGVLGSVWPWLVSSEWLHYGYALLMLAGLWMLKQGMTGRARRAWRTSLWIQVWHHFEHLLLLLQVQTGAYLGGLAPTSILQLFFPRVELHLFYNAIVFVPMMIAMWLHVRPVAAERATAKCRCAARERIVAV